MRKVLFRTCLSSKIISSYPVPLQTAAACSKRTLQAEVQHFPCSMCCYCYHGSQIPGGSPCSVHSLQRWPPWCRNALRSAVAGFVAQTPLVFQGGSLNQKQHRNATTENTEKNSGKLKCYCTWECQQSKRLLGTQVLQYSQSNLILLTLMLDLRSFLRTSLRMSFTATDSSCW